MPALTLHLAKGTVALAPHIALNEVGADFDLVWVDFAAKAQTKPDYLAINPKGRVPALMTENGVLTETAAMLNYIAALHPKAALTPEDTWQRAKMEEVFLYLASTVHINHAHKMRGHRWSDDPATYPAMQAKVASNITENAALIESDYLKGPFVLGETFSNADIYLFTIARWFTGDGADMAAFPKLSAFLEMMQARPSVANALAMHT
ncbi:glutathione S-transferase N-terminal domain-containing protein [uncultured Litoreibacter sp.]|uniref:glutathione S-transferase family protein n=1 Tax=uncultured Litoreibacter sp. TaxID=1392394 RepID=UPI002603C3DC|nr:glutathione S-transferase N-terminal domain-containing protein [uncultured Litoreibacter sp.]